MTTSLRFVLFLLGASLLALAVTGQGFYSRMVYLWTLMLVGNWIWAKLSLRGVRFARRSRQTRAQAGEIYEERFDIQNTSRIPRLWLEVRDHTTLPGSLGSRVLAMIGGKQGRSYINRTRLTQRGIFPLGPTELISGDPFGLFPVSETIQEEISVLVYPLMVEVRAFPSPPGMLPGGEALRRRTHQVTPNASGVREYAPGDSYNRIHWRTTARRNQLMVKEFELDPMAEVWMFIDAARTVQFSLPHIPHTSAEDAIWDPKAAVKALPPSTEEYAATIAASLCRYYLRLDRAVGMVSSGQTLNILPPDRGARQLNKILESLAMLRSVGFMPIAALLTSQARHLPRGSTVVIVTSDTRDEVALAVDQLVRLGLRPVVTLIEAGSFNGPQGTPVLAEAIRSLGVSVTVIANEDDIGEMLTLAGAAAGELSVMRAPALEML